MRTTTARGFAWTWKQFIPGATSVETDIELCAALRRRAASRPAASDRGAAERVLPKYFPPDSQRSNVGGGRSLAPFCGRLFMPHNGMGQKRKSSSPSDLALTVYKWQIALCCSAEKGNESASSSAGGSKGGSYVVASAS